MVSFVNDVRQVPQIGVPTSSWMETAMPKGSPSSSGRASRLKLPVAASSPARRNVSSFVVFATRVVGTGQPGSGQVARIVPWFLLPPTDLAATMTSALVETEPVSAAVERVTRAHRRARRCVEHLVRVARIGVAESRGVVVVFRRVTPDDDLHKLRRALATVFDVKVVADLPTEGELWDRVVPDQGRQGDVECRRRLTRACAAHEPACDDN